MRHLRKYPKSPSIFPNLIGFDEEEESEEETSEDDDSEDEDDDSEEDEDDEGGSEEEEGAKKQGKNGLKSALDKERKARKNLEKELKALRRFKEEQENASKSEKEQAEDRAEKAEKALQAAQDALHETQVNFEISSIARKMRFRDIDDALKLTSRDEIEFDEDGNFDKKAVETAVKSVADAKPHLLLSEGEEGSAPSGSKFGGKKKSDKKATEETLKKKYPALGR